MSDNAGHRDRMLRLADMWDSGEYKHGMEAPRRGLPDQGCAYCIWGLACEMFRLETGVGEWESRGAVTWVFVLPDTGVVLTAPTPVRQWFGITPVEAAALLCINDGVPAAWDRAMDTKSMTPSQYLREAVATRLRAEGSLE